jgi:S1-C subfamily serine protease
MNIPATQAILFVFLIACISQWWLRLFFAPFCAFAILAAVQEASDWRKLLGAFLLLFAPSLASAEIVGVETVGVCNGNQCTSVTGYGSGVIVGTLRDGRAAVLTAGHVVAGSQSVHIGWYRGQRLAAFSEAATMGWLMRRFWPCGFLGNFTATNSASLSLPTPRC